MKKLFLIITLSISTFIVGCGCGNSEPTNTIVPETETQVTELETETEIATEEIIETEETELVSIEIVETLDTIMYVIKDSSIYEGDGTNFKMINTLMKGGTAHVTGKTANGWYEVDCGTTKGYVPADALSTTNPNESTSTEQLTEEEQKRREETTSSWSDFMSQLEEEQESANEPEGSGQGDPKYDGHADAPSTHDWG